MWRGTEAESKTGPRDRWNEKDLKGPDKGKTLETQTTSETVTRKDSKCGDEFTVKESLREGLTGGWGRRSYFLGGRSNEVGRPH